MQNPFFRKAFIDPIPEGAVLPCPIAKLPRVDNKTLSL